jgi:hypothetical protein
MALNTKNFKFSVEFCHFSTPFLKSEYILEIPEKNVLSFTLFVGSRWLQIKDGFNFCNIEKAK